MAENTVEKKEKGSFFKNLKIEFKKIIWPDKKDVAKQTLLIIVVTIIGHYDYMRTLKYFIWKDDVKYNDEGKGYIDSYSELANFIDNVDAGDRTGNDNFATLV